VGTSAAAAIAALATRATDAEADDIAALAVIADSAEAWSRATPLHLTASALVVHPGTGQVLLRWHQRQQAWLQVGGHGDPGETDPLAIALREGLEETGLDDLRPWPDADAPSLLHVVVVDVPANDREPAHRHGDLRYLLATDHPERAVAEDDGAPLRWVSVPDAMALTREENLRETIRRAEAQLSRGDPRSP